MSGDLDVSLRLRLLYQGRQADEAKRDLKDLDRAAEQLGRASGAGALARDLDKVGQEAEQAKARIGNIGREAGDVRQAVSRIGSGLDNVKGEAAGAIRAIHGIRQEANEARAAIGRVGDGAFNDVKSGAASAESAIRQIGQAADQADQKLRNLRAPHIGGTGGRPVAGAPYAPGPFRPSGGLLTSVEGAVDQFGLPVAVGAGAAYLAGAIPAAGGLVAGAAIRAAAGDEFTSDQLRVLGEYGPEDQARYDRMMSNTGARMGVGANGAMGVFGRLMSGGLDAESSAQMTEGAIRFAKATQASPEDAARTTIALRNLFGIGSADMMAAYDAMALGGKEGEFEVPDMAKNFPSIAAKMSALGEGGMSGTRLAVALGQAIRTTAGNSDEASTNFENMLGKLRSTDFLENASKYGIDAEQTMKGAAAKGESPILAILNEIKTKVGTDGYRLKELMPDTQALAGLEAALNNLDNVEGMMGRMEASLGTVMQDFANATDNASSAFDRFTSNVAEKAKYLASYALPPLTAAMNLMSEAMEGSREPTRIVAPEGASAGVHAGVNAANDRGARINRFFESLFGWEKSETSKKLDTVDAYQQYARSRMEGERGAPTASQRFWFGDAATDGFDLKQHMGVDLRPTAEQSMGGYNDALAAEGERAKAQAQAIADQIKSSLGFTVSPTIAPTFVPPSSAPSAGPAAPEKHSSISPVQTNTFNQTIHSPNSKMAAVRSRRANERSIRQAQARSLYDIGRSLA